MNFNFRELDLIEMAIREWLINIKKDKFLDIDLKDIYVKDLEELKAKITYVPKWWEFWK